MLNKSRVFISKNESELLLFMWRHRVSTFQTLRQLFYPGTESESAYNRLRRLRNEGFIQNGCNELTGKTVWCLGEKGFRFLESVRLPELKSKGYRPNSCYHDLYAMAALLGDWYQKLPDDVLVVTEQELLTTEVSCLPSKIQETFKHRPDGLWVKANSKEPSAVALEMEVNGKSASRYEEICSIYGGAHFVENVVWIVPDRALAKKIQSSALACAIPRKEMHLFLLLEDFESNIWNAKILNSSMNGRSLSEFLNQSFEMPYRSFVGMPPETPSEDCTRANRAPSKSPLLDCSLSIERFNAYKKVRRLQNC